MKQSNINWKRGNTKAMRPIEETGASCGQQIDWPTRLSGTNINPETLLATDYLNHFNEVVMLIELLPSSPELAEEVITWRPKSYRDHFLTSGFQARTLAVEAYEHAPAEARAHLEVLVERMNRIILELGQRLKQTASPDDLPRDMRATASSLLRLIHAAGSVINGTGKPDDDLIDEAEDNQPYDAQFSQSDIDSLFD